MKIKLILMKLLPLTLVALLFFNFACNKPLGYKPVIYKTYTLSANDISLALLNHPRFSLEYPSEFSLVDLDLPNPPGEGAMPKVIGMSMVEFTYLPADAELNVTIADPILVKTSIDDQITEANRIGTNVTIKKIMISGIEANYIEYTDSHFLVYSEKTAHKSVRTAIFEYSGLVWSILLVWHYPEHENEPAVLNEYFSHVIDTFTILNN